MRERLFQEIGFQFSIRYRRTNTVQVLVQEIQQRPEEFLGVFLALPSEFRVELCFGSVDVIPIKFFKLLGKQGLEEEAFRTD
jgi:hypothetical protein